MTSAASRIPEEPHDISRPEPHHEVKYYAIFWTLVALTIITVLIGIYLRFSNELVNVVLALLVAGVKATFVARFFMHLKFEGKLIWLIFTVPLCLCVLLIVALIPDVGRGRRTLLNDHIGTFEEMTHALIGGNGAAER